MKLKHVSTGYDLHSHEISYGSGSGQQSVTGFQDTSDANSLWVVSGAEVSEKAECVLVVHCVRAEKNSVNSQGMPSQDYLTCAGGRVCARDTHQERNICEAAACGHQEMATQPPLPFAAVSEFGGALMHKQIPADCPFMCYFDSHLLTLLWYFTMPTAIFPLWIGAGECFWK